MKKLLLLLLFVLNFTNSFGQKSEWSPYVKSSCFQGLGTSAIGYGYSQGGGGYSWNWKVKNNYSRTITCNVSLKIGAVKHEWGTITIEPGKEHQHVSMYYADASNNWMLEITDAYFGTYTTPEGDKCWLNCDNGSPNCQPRVVAKTTTSNNSKATAAATSARVNNSGAYSQSRQQAVDITAQNATMQSQNQENANKAQQYTNAINAGIKAHNSGDYAGAKTQFNNAIGLSTTAQQRTNAQDYYNKSVNSEKSQGKIQAVGNFSQQLIQGLGEIAAENKLRKAQKAKDAQAAAIEAEKAKERAVNTLSDPKIFETYCDFVVANMEALDFKFVKMYNYTIDDRSKEITIDFENDVSAKVQLTYFSNVKPASMLNRVIFEVSKPTYIDVLSQSDLFGFLRELDYFDREDHKNYTTGQYTSGPGRYYYDFTLFGLEKSKPFLNIYMNGYTNEKYKGAKVVLKDLDDNIKAKLSNSNNSAKALMESGDLYRDGKGVEKNNDKALEYYNKALQLGENEAMLSIANIYVNRQAYQEAKQWNEKYLPVGNAKGILKAKYWLAYIEMHLGNQNKAIEYYKELILLSENDYKAATSSREKYNAKMSLHGYYQNIGQCLIDQDNVKEALIWYEGAAGYNGMGAITLAQMYLSGIKSKSNAAAGNAKIKKNKDLAKQWVNTGCTLANAEVASLGDDPVLKKELEGNAKFVCSFGQTILKD